MDSEGRDTTDANDFNAGSLLPIGGHKGFAIGIVMDVLAGALSGGGTSQADPPDWGNATLIMAINPGGLRRPAGLRDRGERPAGLYPQQPACAPASAKSSSPANPRPANMNAASARASTSASAPGTSSAPCATTGQGHEQGAHRPHLQHVARAARRLGRGGAGAGARDVLPRRSADLSTLGVEVIAPAEFTTSVRQAREHGRMLRHAGIHVLVVYVARWSYGTSVVETALECDVPVVVWTGTDIAAVGIVGASVCAARWTRPASPTASSTATSTTQRRCRA